MLTNSFSFFLSGKLLISLLILNDSLFVSVEKSDDSIIKMTRLKDKERILKATSEKQVVI